MLLRTALPVRDDQGILGPLLADHVEVRKLLHHAPRPFGHELRPGIRIGIHAHAGKPQVFDPPDGVLDEVNRHQGIVLVEIGHARHEPAVVELSPVDLRAVGVDAERLGMGRPHVAVPLVHPVVHRGIIHPPVMQPAVIDDHVHDQPDALFASDPGQFPQVFIAALARVHPVEIRGGIAVVGEFRHRVLKHGIQPDCGEAESGDVVEPIDDAPEIAAVAPPWQAPVQDVSHAFDLVVFGIAVGESVRRDQVNRIYGGKAAGVLRVLVAFVQAVGVGDVTVGAAENNVEFPGLGVGADIQAYKQVVRITRGDDLVDRDARPVDAWRQRPRVFAVDQQFQFRVLESDPPVRRLYSLDPGAVADRKRPPNDYRQPNDPSSYRRHVSYPSISSSSSPRVSCTYRITKYTDTTAAKA